MSTSQTRGKQHQHITPPLTPPPTSDKVFTQATLIIALFEEIKVGRHDRQNPWIPFQLARGEYYELERQLKRDQSLFGYVKDKIRYDYNEKTNQIVVRMPSTVHEKFIANVEYAIFRQLELIGNGSDRAALFARKVQLDRSSIIRFPVDGAPPGTTSKYEPDAAFSHAKAKYPGVIVEVSYSQKRKMLGRLAEDYLLDSNTSVQAVIGLDIEHGNRGSRKATLTVWRARPFHTADGVEWRVVQEIADEPFRDDQGHRTNSLGLRLKLKDFAHKDLAHRELGEQDLDLTVSAQELFHYLAGAEAKVQEPDSLGQQSFAAGHKKRKRSATPPEQFASDDEARYAEQEQRAARRMEADDSDYENTS